MSEFYLGSTLMWNAALEEMVPFIYENGLDGIEMWAEQWFAKNYSVEEYLKLTALYPVKTFIHSCSWDLNPASLNEGIRKTSVLQIKRSIDLAEVLHVNEVTVHPGRATIPDQLEAYYDRLHESLKEILSYASVRQIDISLEIMEKIPKEFATSVPEMKKITKELEQRFSYTLDIAHCDTSKDIMDALALGHFSKFHISNRQGKLLHTPLNAGDYDFNELLPVLENFHIPFVVEGFDAGTNFPIARTNIQFLNNYGGEKNEKIISRNSRNNIYCSKPYGLRQSNN